MPLMRIGRPGLLGTVAPPCPPSEAEPDLVSQLARLAQLRDAGALTKEEFQSAKAELLSG